MSREEPKIVHLRVAEAGGRERGVRTASTLAAPGKVACGVTPPVKSMPRFSPRVKSETSEIMISSADSAVPHLARGHEREIGRRE